MKVLKVVVDKLPTGCGWCKFAIEEDHFNGDNPVYCLMDDDERVVSDKTTDYCNTPPDWCPLKEGEE